MNAYLGLGSNLGDRFKNLTEALRRLNIAPGVTVRKASPVYETFPMGGPGRQSMYLNAAVLIETSLDAMTLLETCMSIEESMGRVRRVRWESRAIDIDILLYENQTAVAERLTLPHPRMHEREFVLRPLADIAPNIVHPVIHKSILTLLEMVEELETRRLDEMILRV